jgi:aminoglycoside phosphotransferase (APT) family kinase protein
MYTILGQLSAADPYRIGIVHALSVPSLDSCWRRELDHWEAVLDEDEMAPQPIIRGAIRWMLRNPPPPPTRLHVVHGDYRTGNYLYDQSGRIHGILDWEMVHLGDPLEDLAWSLSPIFDFAGNGLAGGLIPRDRAIAIWEKTSGLTADKERLKWWEVFTAVKGQAIWVSSLQEYVEGSNRDPILAIASLTMMNRQDEAALRALGRMP